MPWPGGGIKCLKGGGENNHVGLAWQHKLLREEVQRIREEHERSTDALLHDSVRGQHVVQ
jgi:hypothetical protein